ncbi:MAG TPA: regulatory protein RecX [Firmicutes bacterium]|nr:regulatory protein RecX [Candidatus Fermentithermobacillaceae bacterium]
MMDVALRILSRRRVSSGEMEALLLRKGYTGDEVGNCLDRLKGWGYLDDRSLARDIVSSMVKACPVGKARAMFELERRRFQKELAREVVEEVYNGLVEEELAKVAAERYFGEKKERSLKDCHRLARWLLRRGFEPETVRSIVSGFGQMCDE